MTIPTTMKAAVTCGEARKVAVKDIAVPHIEPDQVLVKVEAAAANPTDWKSVNRVPTEGNVSGCDFAGFVVSVGTSVSPEQAKVGDRVAGLVHGAASPNGAFAEYTAANADLIVPIPDSWTFEQAAQIGVAMYTACLCLFHVLEFPGEPRPSTASANFDPERTVLIWGGASSVGQSAIQLAHVVGLRVLTTASPASFELVKNLGADDVFNYREADTPEKIKELTNGQLQYVVDCISEGQTPLQISRAVGDRGGKVAVIVPYQAKRQDIKNTHVLTYYLLGKDITIPFSSACNMAQYGARFQANNIIRNVISNGAYRPCPFEVLPNGLESVNDGFKRHMEGNVRAVKLIYRISDTPGLKAAN